MDYDRPVEIAPEVYWVGFFDSQSGLHCNPYLIVDKGEAVVIDGGSRPDFPTVMMKILQTGLYPDRIRALIYQHYDPDLCASLPNFEDIIGRGDLEVISAAANNMFIRHYAARSGLKAIENMGSRFEFSSGRTLQFVKTPYAHAQGSFTTFDPASGILFSSDLFGSYGTEWELFLKLDPECMQCEGLDRCRSRPGRCPLRDILKFHQKLMPSRKALRYALARLVPLPFSIIAPQHGSIITDSRMMRQIVERLYELSDVGIDALAKEDDLAIAEAVPERFGRHAG
jgi:flavorubredoxin